MWCIAPIIFWGRHCILVNADRVDASGGDTYGNSKTVSFSYKYPRAERRLAVDFRGTHASMDGVAFLW